MRKFLSLTAFAVLTTTSLAVAQDNENYNQYENQYAAQNAEMPATMAPTREVLMQDYNNRTYLKENTPNYGVRSNGDASDLTIQRDRLHFDRRGAETLGHRVYDKLVEINLTPTLTQGEGGKSEE